LVLEAYPELVESSDLPLLERLVRESAELDYRVAFIPD
jgi:hypothetical protein